MKVAILKYEGGNICSVDYALKRLGVEAVVTSDREILLSADKVILPGDGEAATSMRYLRSAGLDKLIRDLRQPVLGICLGMQLMCRHSEEGNVDCLSIFDVEVRKFISPTHEFKIPHMGWNALEQMRGTLFKGLHPEEYVYFVHSYYVPVNEYTVAVTRYVRPFSAAIGKDNFYATQFHPEKSGIVGERILQNFLTV